MFYGASFQRLAASAFLSFQLFVWFSSHFHFPLSTFHISTCCSCGTAAALLFYLHTICQFMAVKSAGPWLWLWFFASRIRESLCSPRPSIIKYMLFVFIDFQVKTLLRFGLRHENCCVSREQNVCALVENVEQQKDFIIIGCIVCVRCVLCVRLSGCWGHRELAN